jgi:isoleucyl-tRNA synthetase
MQKAQTISSLVLSLRKKEMTKYVNSQSSNDPDEAFKAEILAIEDLIKVNVKEIELDDAQVF